MHEIIENLKNKIVLNEKIILDLRNYIYNKYPGYSSKKLSLILADGIHKIINNRMNMFHEIPKNEIERKLITDAVSRSDFSINTYMIFCQYCKLNLDNESNISHLYEWLSSNQDKAVLRSELVDFINIMRSYEELPIEDAINNAAESIMEKKGSYYTNQFEEINFKINYPYSEHNTNIMENKNRKTKHTPIEFIVDFTLRIINRFKISSRKGALITASFIIMLIIMLYSKEIGYAFISTLDAFKSKNILEALNENVLIKEIDKEIDNGLPEELQYIEIDKSHLKSWLANKNSILAEEPYLSSIIDTAKQYDINPLFMIAITGQEQGFVPKSQENALKIANNPFNVYESWVGYNTTIDDSSKIAAQTIINLSKGRPEEAHVIQWINEKYAEDKNWWVGVDQIFRRLSKEIIK